MLGLTVYHTTGFSAGNGLGRGEGEEGGGEATSNACSQLYIGSRRSDVNSKSPIWTTKRYENIWCVNFTKCEYKHIEVCGGKIS